MTRSMLSVYKRNVSSVSYIHQNSKKTTTHVSLPEGKWRCLMCYVERPCNCSISDAHSVPWTFGGGEEKTSFFERKAGVWFNSSKWVISVWFKKERVPETERDMDEVTAHQALIQRPPKNLFSERIWIKGHSKVWHFNNFPTVKAKL